MANALFRMTEEQHSCLKAPCWEGVALGWGKDVPNSLSLRSRAGELSHLRNKVDPSIILSSEDEPASLSSVRSDSCLNSMEYWDYSVELECIQGPEGESCVITVAKYFHKALFQKT